MVTGALVLRSTIGCHYDETYVKYNYIFLGIKFTLGVLEELKTQLYVTVI